LLAPFLLWIGLGYVANIWFCAIVAYRFKTGVETCLLLLAAWFVAGLFAPPGAVATGAGPDRK
jgi:hypothetical protein